MVSVRSENTSQQNWDIFGVFVVAVTFLFFFFPITPFFVKSVRPFSFSPVCRKPKTTKGKERFTLCLSEKSEVKGGIKSFWCSHWDFPNRKLFVFRGSKIGTSSYFFLVVGSCNCSFKASAVKRTSSNYLKKKRIKRGLWSFLLVSSWFSIELANSKSYRREERERSYPVFVHNFLTLITFEAGKSLVYRTIKGIDQYLLSLKIAPKFHFVFP